MPLSNYQNDGPIECPAELNLEGLKGKSAVVTGGASGIGKGYVQALVNAGAFVTIGDLNEKMGTELAGQYPGKTHFSKCDVTSWEDQVQMFKDAISHSPEKSCDIVIANAGISGLDDVFALDGTDSSSFETLKAPKPTSSHLITYRLTLSAIRSDLLLENPEPSKPNLKIIDVNLTGVLYTTKLALHYFNQTPKDDNKRDKCLIIQGSLAGYLDLPGSPQYNASKYGCRGLMTCLRRTIWQHGMRVNFIGPWFIKTPIMSHSVLEHLAKGGVEFAEIEDAARAALRIVSDRTLNGRALAIVPRSVVKSGYFDIDHDDYRDNDSLKLWQDGVMQVSRGVVESGGFAQEAVEAGMGSGPRGSR